MRRPERPRRSAVTPLHRVAEVGAIALVGALSVTAAIRLAGGIDTPGQLLLAIAVLPVALALADLASGVVHWLADRVLPVQWPLVGPAFVRPFHDHHDDPLGITRHDFVDVNGNSCLVSWPLAVWAFDAAAGVEGLAAVPVALLLEASVALALTNQIHSWAHAAAPPWTVRALQRVGLVLSRSHHMRHHAPPRDRYFCITTGWMDFVLDRALQRARRRVRAECHGMLPPARRSPSERELARVHRIEESA